MMFSSMIRGTGEPIKTNFASSLWYFSWFPMRIKISVHPPRMPVITTGNERKIDRAGVSRRETIINSSMPTIKP